MTTLVVGATGATGKHVVQMLLEKEQKVKVIVRSKSKMCELLGGDEARYADQLEITEAAVLDLGDDQIKEQVKNCEAVVCCLGHTMDLKGIWGDPRRLVADSIKKLTLFMPEGCRVILMNSDGVANPEGTDKERPAAEKVVLFMLRNLIPPHADNEAAVSYLYERKHQIDWCIVRPTDLVDGDVLEYQIFDGPPGSLFGGGTATRSSVAAFMVDLIINPETWSKYNHKMPVLHNTIVPDVDETKVTKMAELAEVTEPME